MPFFMWYFSVLFQPVGEAHSHKPLLPVAPVEYCREAVVESLTVPLRLGHPVIDPQLFRSFALNMDTRETNHVGFCPVALASSWLHVVAVILEDLGKLQLSAPTLALGGFTRLDYPRREGFRLCFPVRPQSVPTASRSLMLDYPSWVHLLPPVDLQAVV